jgi:hypothetical protein
MVEVAQSYEMVCNFNNFKMPTSWFWSLHISKDLGILRHFAKYFVIEKFHLDGFISS